MRGLTPYAHNSIARILTHLSIIDFPTLVSRMSSFLVLGGCLVFFFFKF